MRTQVLHKKANTNPDSLGQKNHSLQGHNAGPTAKHQTPNAIKRIVIHLGEQTDETLNPGITYVAVSRAKTIGDLGHMM
jgi:hypothetical protein